MLLKTKGEQVRSFSVLRSQLSALGVACTAEMCIPYLARTYIIWVCPRKRDFVLLKVAFQPSERLEIASFGRFSAKMSYVERKKS